MRLDQWPRLTAIIRVQPSDARSTGAGTSFNGRTPASGAGYWGSNPCVPANFLLALVQRHPPGCNIPTVTLGYTGAMLRLLQASAIVAACVLLPGTLTAQEPEASSAPEPRFSASVSLDSNHGAGGSWMQLTPGATYTLSPRWSVEGGVPVYYLTSGATYAGTASIGGIGDAYGSLSLDMSTDAATFYTTVTLSAPTGNVDQGLGAGARVGTGPRASPASVDGLDRTSAGAPPTTSRPPTNRCVAERERGAPAQTCQPATSRTPKRGST